MRYAGSRGIKTRQWHPNEMLRQEDINRIGYETYQNTVDTLLSLSGGVSGAEVFKGLDVVPKALFTCTLKAGSALSHTGSYLTTNSWGFVANTEDSFVAYVPEDHDIAFEPPDVGAAVTRTDILEVRPIMENKDSLTRQFKDPITSLVSTVIVPTGKSFGYEFAIRKGDSATGAVVATTAGWIKLAEVKVAIAATVIASADILTFLTSSTWSSNLSETIYSGFDRTTLSDSYTIPVRDNAGNIKVAPSKTPNDAVAASDLVGISRLDYRIPMSNGSPVQVLGLGSNADTIIIASIDSPFLYDVFGMADAVFNVSPSRVMSVGESPRFIRVLPTHIIIGTTSELAIYPVNVMGTPGSRLSGLQTDLGKVYSADLQNGILVVGIVASPRIKFYRFINDEISDRILVTGGDPASGVRSVKLSYDAVYACAVHGTAPYMTLYKYNGSEYVKMSNPVDMPSSQSYTCSFSPSSEYLAVNQSGAPYLTLYRRSGDTFTKLTITPPEGYSSKEGICWNNDSTLVLAMSASPFVATYSVSGDVVTRMASPAVLPAGARAAVTIHKGGIFSSKEYAVFGGTVSPYLDMYTLSGSVLTYEYSSIAPWVETGKSYQVVGDCDINLSTIYNTNKGRNLTIANGPYQCRVFAYGSGQIILTSLGMSTRYASGVIRLLPYQTCKFQSVGSTPYLKNTATALTAPATGLANARGVAWSPSGEYVAVAFFTASPNLQIYRRGSSDALTSVVVPDTGVADAVAVAWSPDSRLLAVAFLEIADNVHTYSVVNGVVTLKQILTVASGGPYSVSWSPNGLFLAVAYYTGDYLEVFSRDEFDIMSSYSGVSVENARSVAWSPDSQFLAVAMWTASPNLHMLQTPRLNMGHTFLTGVANAFSVAYSPDGKYLAVAFYTLSSSTNVRIYSRSGSLLTMVTGLTPPTGGVDNATCVAWSPDGGLLAISFYTTGENVRTYQWVGESLELRSVINTGIDNAMSVAWSGDGKFLMVGYSTTSPNTAYYKTYGTATNAFVMVSDADSLIPNMGFSLRPSS